MRCKNCNAENTNSSNFCYNCGKMLGAKKNKFSLKNFTYKNIVFSKNKYRNIFILLSILVLFSALSVPLCQGLQESFKIAIDLVNMSMNQEVAKYALKSQTELYFRDVFLRIILILLFWTLLIFDVFMLVYSYALEKRSKKNKNIYWVLLVFVLL